MDTNSVFLAFKYVGCIILLLVGLYVPLQALPEPSVSIRQQVSLDSNVMYGNVLASSTLLTTSVDDLSLTIGLRVLEDLRDVTVQAAYALPSSLTLTRGAMEVAAHVGWGLADSSHMDGVLAYAQQLDVGTMVSANLALGIQAHASLIPSLEEPLFNLLPYLRLSLSVAPIDKLFLTTTLSTTTLFEYSAQCWAPVVGIDAAYRFTNAVLVGFSAFVRFSDIHPETVLILSQEVGVYVILQS